MDIITRNQLLEIHELQQARGRREQGRFLIEGIKIIQEAISSGCGVEKIIVTEEFKQANPAFLETFAQYPIMHTDGLGMKKLSNVITPPDVVAVITLPHVKFEDISESELLACFDGVADPGNMGTMIRTAEWFGVKGIILSPSCVDPYNDKVIRSAMGSLFHLKIYQSTNLVADLTTLHSQGTKIVVTDVHTDSNILPPSLPLCLVMGSESHGISSEVRALADATYTIPGYGQIESLNVGVSFGIALYDITSSLKQ